MKPQPYGPFAYKPINDRPKLSWPGGARVAFYVVPNIEYFALDKKIPGGVDHIPDVSAWGRRDYANRIAVFRMIEVMTRYGVRGTVALNSDVCDMCPQVVDECLKHGWEMMGHCESNTVRLIDVDSDEEATRIVRDTLARIEKATGKKPKGWLGAGRQQTWNTVNILVKEGCSYTVDWDNDDQPVLMDIGGKPLVSMPYGAGVSDLQAFNRYYYTPDDFERMIKRAFDVLYRESEESGRVVAISLHPMLIGLPHRIDALDKGLEYICSHQGVWRATGEEIVNHFLAQQGKT